MSHEFLWFIPKDKPTRRILHDINMDANDSATGLIVWRHCGPSRDCALEVMSTSLLTDTLILFFLPRRCRQ